METQKTEKLTITEEKFLKEAVKFLEHPSPFLKVANMMGAPIEKSFRKLPEKYSKAISQATSNALYRGIEVLATTLEKKSLDFRTADQETRLRAYQHTVLAFGVGAAGGLFGMLALPLELPTATAVMLRSILNIAQEFDMDITQPEIQMECLYILTLGSPQTEADDQMDSAYWTSRFGFASLINQAAKHIATHGLKSFSSQVAVETAPALVKLLSAVAARYEIVVTKKFLSGAVPIIGAVGGGTINAAFTDHLSRAARFHFGMRSLEKKHGADFIKEQYAFIKKAVKDQ